MMKMRCGVDSGNIEGNLGSLGRPSAAFIGLVLSHMYDIPIMILIDQTNPLVEVAPPKKKSNIDQARRLLRGVIREDSDDELGDEDLPWEWIYASTEDGSAPDGGFSSNTPSKRQKAQHRPKLQRIVGAKTGPRFNCQIGDCLLIKGEGLSGEAYVGMACEFTDEDGEMECNVMWFSTEFEIKNKNKRMDYLPVGFQMSSIVQNVLIYLQNELYINPSWNKIPLLSINGKAIIMSLKKYQERYPNGVPKDSKQYGKIFICRRGCAPRTATYTEEFIWEDIYNNRETNIDMIVRKITDETKLTRSRRSNPVRFGMQSSEEAFRANVGTTIHSC